MKKFLFSLLALLSLSAQAQKTAEEVVEKYANNLGGLDSLKKITGVKMIGSVATQGMDFPITMEILNGKGWRMDVEVMDQSITQVYYNGRGWQLNPLAGVTSPTEITGDELMAIKSQASLANNLVDYKNRGHQIALAGEETVEGVKTIKINLTSKDDGKITSYFINSGDFLLLKTSTTRPVNGESAEIENWYSDYKSFGPVKMPVSIIQKVNGKISREINWGSIELNIKVDEKIFAQ